MPCFSSVTQTKYEHAERLQKALQALGYSVQAHGSLSVTGSKAGEQIQFNRPREGVAFTTFETDTQKLNALSRRYSELAVREFAASNKYNIVSSEGGKFVLVNRSE